MRWLIVSLILATSAYASEPRASDLPDVIECQTPSGKKLYAIEELITPSFPLHAVDFWTFIAILQNANFRGLSMNAINFYASEKRPPQDFSNYNVWEEAAFGLDPVPLGPLADLLPDGCDRATAVGRRLWLLQTTPNANIYRFDPALRSELKKHPLTYSLVLLRGWLKQWTEHSDAIRDINLSMHRNRQPKLAIPDVKRLLPPALGISKAVSSVCDRSHYVLEAIVRTLKKDCGQVTAQDLASIKDLEIIFPPNRTITFSDYFFRSGDFSGLEGLRSFHAKNVLWFGNIVPEGLFWGMPNLRHLDLEKTFLELLNEHTFAGLTQLESLNLYNAEIGMISPGVFAGRFTTDPKRLTTLNLGGNNDLGWLTKAELAGLENLKELNLSRATFFKGFRAGALASMPNLQSLDLSEVYQPVVFEGDINDATAPSLKILNWSRTNHIGLSQIGAHSKLETLDISHINSFLMMERIDRFPNLKRLNLDVTRFGVDAEFGGLRNLKHLEELSVMKSEFFDKDSLKSHSVFEIFKYLPPNLKILEICHPELPASAFFENQCRLHVIDPGLVIRSKDYCQGDWIEHTY